MSFPCHKIIESHLLTRHVKVFCFGLKVYICKRFLSDCILENCEKNFVEQKTVDKVTKAEVISEISAKTGLEKVDVQEVVESFFKVVKENMSEGNNIYFRGFGSFVVKKRARKVARNIAENKSIVIPPHYVPSFKPSKTFSERVKNNVKV